MAYSRARSRPIVFVVFSMLTMTESFVKKLYVTLGVHSKQDLIELVNKAR